MNRGIKIIFWGAEIAFALISGISEALIYQAYSQGGFWGDAEAFVRAAGMQLMIMMFGYAAVQASRHGRRGLVILANMLAFAFSFISFWLIRESALAEAHFGFLQSAYNNPLTVPSPWGNIVLDGRVIDPLLIACLPFLQTALNWFAPVITQDLKPEYVETIEEMQQRQQRELIQMEFAQKKRELGARGVANVAGAFGKAAVDQVRGRGTAQSDGAASPVEAPASATVVTNLPSRVNPDASQQTGTEILAGLMAQQGA
jgi:hypothetical protein